MQLISATPSPWARKVRIVLFEKNIQVEVLNDIPWAPETCVPQFNPLEKLPILITDDGESVYESRLIVEWIERRYPQPPMIPSDDGGYLACKKFEVLADSVLDAQLLFFMDINRKIPNPEWMERQGRKIVGGVAEVARLIGDHDFAVADRFTLADAAVGAMLTSLEFVEQITGREVPEVQWRARHPNLASYLNQLEERSSFVATRPVMFEHDFAEN